MGFMDFEHEQFANGKMMSQVYQHIQQDNVRVAETGAVQVDGAAAELV